MRYIGLPGDRSFPLPLTGLRQLSFAAAKRAEKKEVLRNSNRNKFGSEFQTGNTFEINYSRFISEATVTSPRASINNLSFYSFTERKILPLNPLKSQ